MATTQFQHMKHAPLSRTPIVIISGEVKRHCHKCKRLVMPTLINAAFLSRPLEKCSLCNSVIQGKAGIK